MNSPELFSSYDEKQLGLETVTESTIPNYCCYCGAPANKALELDARQSQQRYGYKRTATIEFGDSYRVPYCSNHYQSALIIRQKLERLARINSNATWIPILLGITIGIGGVYRSAITQMTIGVLGSVLFSLAVGGFLGALLAGALLFTFEPLTAWLAGALFLLFLESHERKDLADHMKAQHLLYPFSILQITYSFGFSVKYDVEKTDYTWKKWEIKRTLFSTSPKYAVSVEGVQCVQENKTENLYENLVSELIEIGKSTKTFNEGDTYFFRSRGEGVGPGDNWDFRTREIGEELYKKGGFKIQLMQEAHIGVVKALGPVAGRCLEAHWHEIGLEQWKQGKGEVWLF